MSQSLHTLHHCPLNLIRRGLTHLRGGTPVILTGQEIDGAFLGVDGGDAVAGVEAAEVEVEVAVENAVGLPGVHVPD